jgi:hypothetical protein
MSQVRVLRKGAEKRGAEEGREHLLLSSSVRPFSAPRRETRLLLRSASVVTAVALALALSAACGSRQTSSQAAPAPVDKGADWSEFSGTEKTEGQQIRGVPESPIEITGVPYVHAIRLAWSRSEDVPSYEPDNQTLRLPADSLQAVLLVAVEALPETAALRVDWYFGDQLVFTDSLSSRDDGDHFFSLVKREGRRLAALPRGQYRAEVLDGPTVLKTIRFEVAG